MVSRSFSPRVWRTQRSRFGSEEEDVSEDSEQNSAVRFLHIFLRACWGLRSWWWQFLKGSWFVFLFSFLLPSAVSLYEGTTSRRQIIITFQTGSNWYHLHYIQTTGTSAESGSIYRLMFDCFLHPTLLWFWLLFKKCVSSEFSEDDSECTLAFCSRFLTKEELRNSLSWLFSSCSRASSSSLCSRVSWSWKFEHILMLKPEMQHDSTGFRLVQQFKLLQNQEQSYVCSSYSFD